MALPAIPGLRAPGAKEAAAAAGAEAPRSADKALSNLQAGASLSGFSGHASNETLNTQAAAAFDHLKPASRGSGAPGVPADGGGAGPASSADDGGGADYPRDKVGFNEAKLDAVALRPNVPVEAQLVEAIDAAKKSIHIALFEFALSGVMDALVRARARGVAVHVVMDYSNVFPQLNPEAKPGDRPARRSDEIQRLLRAEGLDVTVLRGLGQFGINHNKIAVFDFDEKQALSEFGSYNWAFTAEVAHYENANFTAEPARVKALMAYWGWLKSASKPVTLKSKASDYSWPAKLSELPPLPPELLDPALTVNYNGISLPAVVVSPHPVPGRTIEDRLVAAINATRPGEPISMSIFAVESTRVAQALAQAHARGVLVRVIMDEGQATGDESPFKIYAQYLAYHGVAVSTLSGPDPDSRYPRTQKNHNKFTIFGGKLLETGSANYTKYSSIANFENAQFFSDADRVAAFAFAFSHMLSRAKPFPKPASEPKLPTDAELVAAIDRPAAPPTEVPSFPAPAKGVQPRAVPFNGRVFDSYRFRPDLPIEPALADAIDAANKSVRLAIYEFDLESVMDALRRAKKRGLHIEIVVDHDHVYTSGLDYETKKPKLPSAQIQALINEGFDILVENVHNGSIQHNKFPLLDAEDVASGGGLVGYGSYNVANSAEHNHFENFKFSNDAFAIKDFLAYFNYLRENAEPVDMDKLKRTLAGVESVAAREFLAEPMAEGSPTRAPKIPPPPASQAPSFEFNGEQFLPRYFSPGGGIKDAWLRAIKAAKSSVNVAMFSFYSKEIAYAMAEAAQNGRDARAVLDESQSHAKYALIDGVHVADWLVQHGVKVKILSGPNSSTDEYYKSWLEKQHNKFLTVDGRLLFNGSFNASDQADKHNQENANLTTDPADVAGFVDYFERMWSRGWEPSPSPANPKPGPALAAR